MLFHPYEIGFSGFSNTGKTTSITHLIKDLQTTYQIGYIKHASCGFSLDAPGKDSDLVYQSGAKQIHLVDDNHSATIKRGARSLLFDNTVLLENDFVFIEGYKDLLHEKIVFLDSEKKILERAKNIIATVGTGGDFSANDYSGLATFVINHFRKQANKLPLYGLVLGGGFSKRMGRDKALMSYDKKTQAETCYDLLLPFCEKVFVSRRKEQEALSLPLIFDDFQHMGPLGGILSAMRKYPKTAWFVLACDYPLMDKETLEELLLARNPFKFATTYEGTDRLPEPLCAIYETKSYSMLLQLLAQGQECPRKALMQAPAQLVQARKPEALTNVNEPLSAFPLHYTFCQNGS